MNDRRWANRHEGLAHLSRQRGRDRCLRLRTVAGRWVAGTAAAVSYQSAQRRWAAYCAKAGLSATMHQLRHTHATELVNDGVSLATIRKRLGHKNLQTTQRYAEQTDHAADQELRQWRRRKQSRS